MTKEEGKFSPRRLASRRRQAAKIDNFLIKLSLIFVTILLLSQCLLLPNQTRQFFSMVDKMEGDQIPFTLNLHADNEAAPSIETIEKDSAFSQMSKMAGRSLYALRPSQSLVICMLNPQNSETAFVLVNGKPMADFGVGKVMVEVYDGDYVELDLTKMNEPSQFVVNIADTGKIISPLDGMLLEGRETILPVGKVKLK